MQSFYIINAPSTCCLIFGAINYIVPCFWPVTSLILSAIIAILLRLSLVVVKTVKNCMGRRCNHKILRKSFITGIFASKFQGFWSIYSMSHVTFSNDRIQIKKKNDHFFKRDIRISHSVGFKIISLTCCKSYFQ